MLLDAIRFAETGHLSPSKARTAVSPKGAQGPYQFLGKNLNNMGYGMPMNIPLSDVQDPTKARELANQYITGYSDYHNFTTPLEMLVAYNMGPTATVEWKARGGRVEDLPNETQQYLKRAAQYLNTAPTNEGNIQMAQKGQGLTQDEVAQLALADANMMMQPYAILGQNDANQMAMADANMGTQPYAANSQMAQTASSDEGYLSPILSALNPISSAQAETLPAKAADSTPAQNLPQTGKADPPVNLGPGLPILTEYTPVTGRRRDQSNMTLPSQKIDMNEALIRIGLATVAASERGGPAALGAMGDTYGQIMDANRSAGLDAYNAALEAASNSKSDLVEAQTEIVKYDQTLDNFEKARGFLSEGGLTGLYEGTVGASLDSFLGNPEAGKRLLLERLRVDDVLLRIAETKGAISNKEMEIFERPAPSMTADEQVWLQWVNDRIEAITTVRNNLARINGLQQRSVTSTTNSGLSEEDQNLINKYQ